jgi:glutamine cyclotransferase
MVSSFPYSPRLLFALALGLLAGCSRPVPATPVVPPPPAAPIYYTYDIVNAFPHDRGAFTEGLVFINGRLYESTGLNGQSTLREVNLATGAVVREITLPNQYFGEGLTVLGDKAYQLTWQNQLGFVYDLATFKQEAQFTYTGEGWGLTTDGHSLIMSDGTSQIRFFDPATFAVQRTITVANQGQPVKDVNELEYIKGEIYANKWQTDYVLRIDPASGRVVGVIDFRDLLPSADRTPDTDVLNGIAYDAATDRLFITGKRWPKIFEVRLHPVNQAPTAKP